MTLRYRTYSILLLLLSLYCRAQERNYTFTHLTAKDGLLSDHVYSIQQDHKGFVWFGTAGGLQRYDGNKIVMFLKNPLEQNSISPNNISQVLEDANHRFWVRSGKQVSIFDPAAFSFTNIPVNLAGNNNFKSDYVLKADTAGNVFLLVTHFGVLQFNSVKREFSAASKIPVPAGWTINSFDFDPTNGNYWMGGDSGLCIFDPKTKEVYHRRNNPSRIRALEVEGLNQNVSSLLIDLTCRLWITTEATGKDKAERFCYNLASNSFENNTPGLTASAGKFVLQKNGVIWTTGQLHEYLPDLRRFRVLKGLPSDANGIMYNEVYCFFEDREHNIWLGTDNGVYILNPGIPPFSTVKTNDSNSGEISTPVTCFSETREKSVLAGTWGNGLFAYDSAFRPVVSEISRATNSRKDNFSFISSILQTKTGAIWIGCRAGNLAIFNPGNNTTSYITPQVLKQQTINQMIEDLEGDIWLSTTDGLLVRWDAASGSLAKGFILVHDFKTTIYKLGVDNKGKLWIATDGHGLFKLDPSGNLVEEHYTSNKGAGRSLFSNVVVDFVQLNDSVMALSSGCLNLLNIEAGTVRFMTYYDGLPTTTITNLQKDKNGFLWLATLSGIIRFNPQNSTISRYGSKEGITGNNYNKGASFRLSNGKVCIGTGNTFLVFQPSGINYFSIPPDVRITYFNLVNRYLVPDSIIKLDKVRLHHRQNSFTIDYAALSFLQNDKIIYYYRLIGLEKDWTRADILHNAKYTNLSPGDYVFQVRCENENGIRSKNITTLKIFIQPPFWQRWWFYLLVIFCALALIYLAYRVRINQLLDMERVRSRIARDLHDDMGSTLSTINILSEMAKTKIDSDSKAAKEYITKIGDNCSRMMESMDDIVWSINPMNDSMQRITARMREFSTGILEAKDIDISFTVAQPVVGLKLNMEARRDFFLIFKEAINNVAKYSQATLVHIEVLAHHSMLVMKIQDNGIGFESTGVKRGNGLQNMQKRAGLLNGKLLIESSKGSGTRVELQIPVQNR